MTPPLLPAAPPRESMFRRYARPPRRAVRWIQVLSGGQFLVLMAAATAVGLYCLWERHQGLETLKLSKQMTAGSSLEFELIFDGMSARDHAELGLKVVVVVMLVLAWTWVSAGHRRPHARAYEDTPT